MLNKYTSLMINQVTEKQPRKKKHFKRKITPDVRETPIDHDYCENGKRDKIQSEIDQSSSGSFLSEGNGKKFIHSRKDLQKQNEIVSKRFKAKIVKIGDESYECRSCSGLFSSHISALRHVKAPKCQSKKRKSALLTSVVKKMVVIDSLIAKR